MWQDDVTATDPTNPRMGGADDIWGAGFQMNLTDSVEFVAYHNSINFDGGSDEDLTTIGINWYPVSGLKVFTAYSTGDAISGTGVLGISSPAGSADGDELSYDQFLIGLRRSF